MENLYKDNTIKEFLDKLGSKDCVPAGGSAVALSCALSTALATMVLNLTKDGVGGAENFELGLIKTKFLRYMQEDADIFSTLMECYRLPKSTDEEKEIRNRELQLGYLIATDTPYNICEASMKLYDSLLTLAEYGNSNLISDIAIATLNLHSAVESSIINILINLKHITSDKVVSQTREFIQNTRKKNDEFKTEIMDICNKKMRIE